MNSSAGNIEARLKNMKKFYEKTSQIIDNLPDSIPNETKNKIKDAVLGDKELKELMDGIEANRPPKLFVIGRTGIGKSSLINALCNSYVAPVSDTRSCTATTQEYQCKSEGRVLMEIIDTRGIAESEALDGAMSAEDMLIKQINEFSPDAALFVLDCNRRDDVVADVNFLKRLTQEYYDVNHTNLPIIVVLNRVDELAPSWCKIPKEYPKSKMDNIDGKIHFYKEIIMKNGLEIENIIAVSSLIGWKTEEGEDVSAVEINKLTAEEIDKLQIAFDGRYNIEALIDILEEAIQDLEARMGLRMAARLNEVVNRVAKHLTKVLSGISGTIALTPIPISDIYILLILQGVLVILIASLSGRELSLDSALDFILNMGGATGIGYACRILAQQCSKFFNLLWPGSGSVVSAIIAGGGTTAIGNAARSYYLDGKSIAEAKKVFEKCRDEQA